MTTPDIVPADLLQPTRRRTAREVLKDRVLTVASGEAALHLAHRMDRPMGGLVITGKLKMSTMRKLSRTYPDMVLMAETDCHHEYVATADAPFHLPEHNGLFPASTLEEYLAGQRDMGASVVLLPSGYVAAGDTETLRELIERSNAVPGDDVLLPLYLAAAWLNPKYMQFLTAAVGRSTHPVAVGFGSQASPLDTERRLELSGVLLSSGAGALAWHTDLAGIASIARGALGAAIGAVPGQRRITPPSKSGHARRPDDSTPYVLIPHHLHYMTTRAMQDELYVGRAAPSCDCRECQGRRIDRFTDSVADKLAAEAHNLEIIERIARPIYDAPATERQGIWREQVIDAVVAHEETGAQVGRTFNPGLDVRTWAEG